MINILIKLLGGITVSDYKLYDQHQKNIHKEELELMRQKSFRVGDVVYINDGKKFNANKPYYLLEPYNGWNNRCWYVGDSPDSTQRNTLSNGVLAKYITYERPKHCPTCNHPIL